MPWSALITGGLSAIGGLFGAADARSAQKKHEETVGRLNTHNQNEAWEVATRNNNMARGYAETDYMARMVSQSEASGFNPLTVLRAGGLSALSNLGSSAMMASIETPFQWQAPGQSVIPSTGSVLANAASSAFQDYRQIMAGRAPDTRFLFSGEQGVSYQGRTLGGATGNAAFQAAGGLAGAVSGLRTPTETGDRTNTPPTRWFNNDPDSVDVGVAEEAAGDIGGTAFFPVWVADQVYYNTTGIPGAQRDSIAASAASLVWNQYKSIFGNLIGFQQSAPLSRVDRINAAPNYNFGAPRDGY